MPATDDIVASALLAGQSATRCWRAMAKGEELTQCCLAIPRSTN